MRKHFESIGKDIPISSSFIKVLELYELEIEKSLRHFNIKDINAVKYPSHPMTSLHNGTFLYQYESSVHNISNYIRHKDVSTTDVINLIHILAELVKFDVTVINDKVYSVHKVMPEIIISFAQGDRVHSRLRLLNFFQDILPQNLSRILGMPN